MKNKLKTKTFNAYVGMRIAILVTLVVLSGCQEKTEKGTSTTPAAAAVVALVTDLTVTTTKNADGSFSVQTNGPVGASGFVRLYTTPDPEGQEPEMVTADGTPLYDRGGEFKTWLTDNESEFVVGGTTFGENAIEAAIGDTFARIVQSSGTESSATQVVTFESVD